MYIKLTKSGPRQYVQLVESFRDDNGRPKQRTIASLGRIEKLSDNVDSVISGLLRVTGQNLAGSPSFAATQTDSAPDPDIQFSPTRSIGDVWALTALWCELKFDSLSKIFRSTKHRINIEALLRIMVFNRLCDPQSKLGTLRWLQTVSLPKVSLTTVQHQHLLRAMDAMIEHQDEVDDVLSSLLRPMVDQELSIVFYDLTTISVQGQSTPDCDLRQWGMSKEGLIKRQVMLGVVQTADGLPIYHEVFMGNTAEVSTLIPTLEKVVTRFPIKRIIVVADRGLLSTNNLDELLEVRLPNGEPLEFILAVPGRRYKDFIDLLRPFHATHCADVSKEVTGEVRWNNLRLVIAHDPQVAATKTQQRDETIKSLEGKAQQWVGKLNAQDGGKSSRGRKLSDGGTRAKFYQAVIEARLGRIIRVDMKSDLFSYEINDDALSLAQLNDGKLLLVTNTPDMSPEEVIKRYKSLADIERGFRVLKSEIEIGPVRHWLPDRIRAHASICFIALILHRVMRQRLKSAKTGVSPETALAQLGRIQHHQIKLDNKQMSGISTISNEQNDLLASLKTSKPSKNQQLSLL